jgi:hypothetical protein
MSAEGSRALSISKSAIKNRELTFVRHETKTIETGLPEGRGGEGSQIQKHNH